MAVVCRPAAGRRSGRQRQGLQVLKARGAHTRVQELSRLVGRAADRSLRRRRSFVRVALVEAGHQGPLVGEVALDLLTICFVRLSRYSDDLANNPFYPPDIPPFSPSNFPIAGNGWNVCDSDQRGRPNNSIKALVPVYNCLRRLAINQYRTSRRVIDAIYPKEITPRIVVLHQGDEPV